MFKHQSKLTNVLFSNVQNINYGSVSTHNCSLHIVWSFTKNPYNKSNYGVYSSFSFQYKLLWKYTNNLDEQIKFWMIYTKFYQIYVVDGIFLQNSCFESIPGQQTEKLLMNFILVVNWLSSDFIFCKRLNLAKSWRLGAFYIKPCVTLLQSSLSINPWSQKSEQKIKNVLVSHLSFMNKSYLQTFHFC